MRPHTLILLATLAATLASCQSMTPQERRAADERTCAGYGFKAGTEGMARCLLDIDLDRRAERREWSARIDGQRFPMHPIIIEQPVIVRTR